MMQKTKLAVLMGALLWGAAVGTTSAAVVAADQQVAREAGEPPRGQPQPGDNRGRGGKVIEQFDQLAREATEAPRGQDNNNNRRGRGGKVIEQFDQLAHGATFYSAANLRILFAKKGADDPLPKPCDDHGTNLCRS